MIPRIFRSTFHHPRVVAAIARAEKETSGEIRVVISRRAVPDPVKTAQEHFDRLGMSRTRHRNGVLILIAPSSRTFAVIGDSGIHEKCGREFWNQLTEAMSAYFKRGQFTEGLEHGILTAGKLLAVHFPREPGDGNELPDRVETV